MGKAVEQELVCPDPESDAYGTAVLKYAKGADKTNINVQGRGLEPDATYTVLLCDCDYVECESIGSFTANKNGKGCLQVLAVFRQRAWNMPPFIKRVAKAE